MFDLGAQIVDGFGLGGGHQLGLHGIEGGQGFVVFFLGEELLGLLEDGAVIAGVGAGGFDPRVGAVGLGDGGGGNARDGGGGDGVVRGGGGKGLGGGGFGGGGWGLGVGERRGGRVRHK